MKVQEYLNGGVVQTRHPLLLQPGEVQAADNCILKPGDPALHKVAGRNSWGTVRAESVAGCSSSGLNTLITTTTSNGFATAHTPDTALVAGNSNIHDSGGSFSVASVGQSVYIDSGTADTHILRVVSSTQIEIDKPIPAALDTLTPEVRLSNFHKGAFVTATAGQYTEGTKVVSVDSTTTMTVDTSAVADTTFSAAFSDPIVGLTSLTFDHDKNDVMLAKAGHTISQAPLTNSATGTFSSLKTGLTHSVNSYLQSVTSGDKHFIITGEDHPLLAYYTDDQAGAVSVTSRTAGMLPVGEEAFIGPYIYEGGTWPDGVDDEGGVGYYNFVITEVMKTDGEEVEGTYEGAPKYVHIRDPATQGITVRYGAAGGTSVNDGLYSRNLATHWRVYMAPVEPDSIEPPSLSVFTAIVDVPIANATVDLINESIFRSAFCGDTADVTTSGNEETFFPEGNTNFIAATEGQTSAADCICTINTGAVSTTGNGFATVSVGMFVVSPSDNIPSGSIVTAWTDANNIEIDPHPDATVTEALSFSNNSTINEVSSICYANSSTTKYKTMFCYNFDFSHLIGGFAGATITGIRVELMGRARSLKQGSFAIQVFKGGSSGTAGKTEIKSGFRESNGTKATSRRKITAGGKDEDWGITNWVSTDFDGAENKFGVKVTKQQRYSEDGGTTEEFDGMKVTVYAGFNTVNGQGNPFDTIVVKEAVENSVVLPARYPPPICSTGDVFNGIMVLNDVAEENIVAGSRPDDHEAFPALYRIPIQSKDNDKVTLIRRLGNILIIGMENSIKRMNYFPLETDPDFTRGRAYEDVATDHGIVGRSAAALLDLPGRGVVLAYLSAKGLYWTDGITTTPLNVDLDWDSLFQYSLIHRTVLTVYPRKQILVMSYVPSGATEKTKAMYFSYSPSHMKQQMYLPATGPVDMKAESSTHHLVTGKSYLYSGHSYNGIVYEEDQGVADESGGGPIPVITTRQFLGGKSMGDEGRLRHVHLLLDANGTAGVQSAFTGTVNVQNEGEASSGQDTFAGSGAVGGITQIWSEIFGDTFNISITQLSTAVAFTINYFGFDFQAYGESSS